MIEEFQILMMRKAVGTGGDVVALCDVVIGPVKIIGVKIISKDGGFFCAMPSEIFYSKSAGRQLNRAQIHVEDDLKSRIYEEILTRWNEFDDLKFKNEERGEIR